MNISQDTKPNTFILQNFKEHDVFIKFLPNASVIIKNSPIDPKFYLEKTIPFLSFREIIEQLLKLSILPADLTPKKLRAHKSCSFINAKIKTWKINKIRKLYAHIFSPIYKKQRDLLDPDLLAFHRKTYSTIGPNKYQIVASYNKLDYIFSNKELRKEYLEHRGLFFSLIDNSSTRWPYNNSNLEYESKNSLEKVSPLLLKPPHGVPFLSFHALYQNAKNRTEEWREIEQTFSPHQMSQFCYWMCSAGALRYNPYCSDFNKNHMPYIATCPKKQIEESYKFINHTIHKNNFTLRKGVGWDTFNLYYYSMPVPKRNSTLIKAVKSHLIHTNLLS